MVARYGPSLAELNADWWEGWPVPWYSHRYAILSRLAPQFLPGRVPSGTFDEMDESGVSILLDEPLTPEAYRRNLEQALRCYAPCFKEFRLGGASCTSLRELLELCRKEHVAAALVLMPEGTIFRDLYTPEASAQIEAFLTGLSREFDAPLVNARHWVGDDGFSDAHHLLVRGAAQFTERLGRDHLESLLAGTRSVRR